MPGWSWKLGASLSGYSTIAQVYLEPGHMDIFNLI